MEDNTRNDVIPRATLEGAEMRAEIRDKRKDHIIIVLIVAILLNNLAWLWFFNQFDFASDMVTLDSSEEGNASYMGAGASGVIDNGRGKSQDD